MRIFLRTRVILLSILALINATSSIAGDSDTPTQILINNVHVWDGISDGLTKSISVFAGFDKNIRVMIKDGNIFKNTI